MYSENYDDERYIYIRYFCVLCDEEKNELVQIAFTSESERRYNFTADEDGKVDYSELPLGVYEVEMFGESGQTLTWYQLTIAEEVPAEPETPSEQGEEQEETPTETETPSEQDGDPFADLDGEGIIDETGETENNTEKPEQNTGNSGLMTGIIIALVLLGAGAVVTLILMKKKKNKDKKEKESKQ